MVSLPHALIPVPKNNVLFWDQNNIKMLFHFHNIIHIWLYKVNKVKWKIKKYPLVIFYVLFEIFCIRREALWGCS